MKIWLNHTLACPDDASYPLQLTIFEWEKSEYSQTEEEKDTNSTEEMFKAMIEGYKSKTLCNIKGSNPPLTIHLKPSKDISTHEKDIENAQTEERIVRLKKNLLFDMIVITAVPPQEFLQKYKDILDEFSVIKDLSGKKLAQDAYKITTQSILPIIDGKLNECKKIPKKEKEIEKFLESFMQELLFLNFYLTYVEIEEGLLACPHCKRWFPIIMTIPRIYPKFMKREVIDLDFLKKWQDSYPKDVILD